VSVPRITYPPGLPISRRTGDIAAAIRDHQVVVVAGETGSGKTTQLPKICLELGRGVRGMIGHTQPRRIAARTVADRVAAELGTPLGGVVGYQVRFTDRVGPDTLVKLMTDGILLAEIQRDRLLRRYDTLIIDEAHERSLNIDLILGYLKGLLPRRPDLRVVITSATIDPERFAGYFAGPGGEPAPIIEVSGRGYPVQVRYRPIVDPDDENADPDRDQTQAILDAVDELAAEPPGDVLVFCSGEREIRDTADALAGQQPAGTEILPLYARLSTAEQHRVFQPHAGRRIVLATNVAETSLTVPGIRYVVDPGTARISRYSHRLKVQRLPIEAISQASANQRAGRCGRTADGVCIRLYTEADYASRPEFTDPEILRTNLASVILQMAAAELGDVATFGFLDPPDRRNIADGVALLHELGALDPATKRLTPLGRRLAQLPVDPRLGRMVLAAADNGCLREVMVVAAALSIQDPRERPVEQRAVADEKHARFVDKDSDFTTYLNLWEYLAERQRELSGNQLRKLCRAEHLSYLRVREWQDIYAQLRQVVRGLGLTPNTAPAEPPLVHRALLAGLLSHLGMKDGAKQEYVGARNARFAIFPGSALAKRPPQWVMAAELVETSRLWGRVVARVEPGWAEELAPHLVRRSYSEPHWSKRQGAVMAYEKVTLYGVPIVANRLVSYARVDPALARELFIRHALVEGDWATRHQFFHANRALLEEVEDLEHRVRRRDILVDDETLFEFYAARIPAEVVSGRHFDSWWKKARRAQPDLLDLDRVLVMGGSAGAVSECDYPDEWPHGELRLPLAYTFEPGTAADGVTVRVPLALLNQLDGAGFDWQVRGLREELVIALIRSLPKPVRRGFVPVPDVARAVLARVTPYAEPLLDALERELAELTGVVVPREAWELDRVPDHLRLTFRVVDEQDGVVAEGKDLAALTRRLADRLRAALSAAGSPLERAGLRTWSVGTLPPTYEREQAGYRVTAYPALVDEGDSVAVRLLATAEQQRRAMWAGTRRLLLLTGPSPVRMLRQRLASRDKLALSHNPHGSVAVLLDDCIDCAVDRLLAEGGGPVWDEAGFGTLAEVVRVRLGETVVEVVGRAREVLAEWHGLELRLGELAAPVLGTVLGPALADIRGQVGELVYPGFVAGTGWSRLPDLVRYLQAVGRRLDKLPERPERDREWMARVDRVWQAYRRLVPVGGPPPDGALAGIRWMIEELRVSYFAQTLGTPYPVSDVRILRALDALPS